MIAIPPRRTVRWFTLSKAISCTLLLCHHFHVHRFFTTKPRLIRAYMWIHNTVNHFKPETLYDSAEVSSDCALFDRAWHKSKIGQNFKCRLRRISGPVHVHKSQVICIRSWWSMELFRPCSAFRVYRPKTLKYQNSENLFLFFCWWNLLVLFFSWSRKNFPTCFRTCISKQHCPLLTTTCSNPTSH